MLTGALQDSLFFLDPLFRLFLLFRVFIGVAQDVIADLFKPVLFKLIPV